MSVRGALGRSGAIVEIKIHKLDVLGVFLLFLFLLF